MEPALGPDVRDQPDRGVIAPASCRIYLVRHCQAAGQAPDAPLTPEGIEQAHALADLFVPLGIGRIVSSPFRRAVDSCAPLAARIGVPVETDGRLVERTLTTQPLPDWRAHLRRSFADEHYMLRGGESSRAATDRAVAALDAAPGQLTGAVVVVTHGNLLALLLRHCDGRDGFASWEALTNPDVYQILPEKPEQPIIRIWTLTQ